MAPPAPQRASLTAAAEDTDCSTPKENRDRDSTKRAASSLHASPSHQGPVSKKHLTYHQATNDDDDEPDFEQEQTGTLAAFLTTDNPVSENMLKHMLLLLQKDLRKDIKKSISHMQSQIDDLGECTDTLEHQLSNYVTAYSSRRNNLKIRGIPETVSPAELTCYLQQLFKLLVPSLATVDLTIDRTHRIFKRHIF